MAWYMLQAAYTSEAWAAQVGSPANRFEQLKQMVEPMGGTLHHMWYCFGEYDVVLIVETPGNVEAAGMAIAAAAGGAIKALRTTPLMSVEEGMDAMRTAGSASYRPPAG